MGLPEILIIAAAALLVFGPKRLPELAKSLGKGIRDFKKALEGGGNDDDTHDANHKDNLPPASGPSDTIAQTEKKKESDSSH